jgi:aminoglycoside 6'-N-acetyltransferase I
MIIDLTEHELEQAAVLLRDSFRNRTRDWQDLASAREEVRASLQSDRVSRIALDGSGDVVGWIAAILSYGGRVWEIHPLVVSAAHRRRGVGRALVEDLERVAAARGALTLWLGSDDEHGETSAGGIDLYADLAGAVRDVKTLHGEHPLEFYRKLGFQVTGFLPDANGPGKPEIFFARRVANDRRIR